MRDAGAGALVLDERLQISAAQRMPQLPQRLGLDLADALAGHREPLTHFLQRVLTLLADAEAETQDLLFLGRQGGERALDLSRQILAEQGVVGRPRRLVLEEVTELRVLADRGLQRERL